MVSYLEPTLGLLAFTLLMWVTLPWAFWDKLEIDVLKRRYKGVSDADINKARNWLALGVIWYLGSGIIFLLEVVFVLAAPALPQVSSPEYIVSLSEQTPAFIFIFGLVFLGVAIFRTHQVIWFLLHPEQASRISRFGAEALVSARNITSPLVIAFWSVELLLLVVFLPETFSRPLSLQNFTWYLLTSSLFLGCLSIIPIVNARKRTLTRMDLIGPILAFLPFVVLFLIGIRVLSF